MGVWLPYINRISLAIIKFRVDDPLDAFPVNVIGLWVVIIVGIFNKKHCFIYGKGWT